MRVTATLLLILIVAFRFVWGQKNYTGPPMFIDVNAIKLDMKKSSGEGHFTSQFSWLLGGSSQLLYYPQDEWRSQMLYQIFNPIVVDDSGFVNQDGEKTVIPRGLLSPQGSSKNDWSWESRRYRPPNVITDGIQQNQEYPWEVDPTQNADIKAVWEDIIILWGIRVRVEIYALSNANHEDYIIWNATYKFTGETKRPIENPTEANIFPDQTVRLWWPLSFVMGPTRNGGGVAQGSWGHDDLDSWFGRKSELVTDRTRDTLKVAYYWDWKKSNLSTVYSNGSTDDMGDPSYETGHLMSPQIPGYALLYSAKNSINPNDDDLTQPYAMPHATILGDFWGRRDYGLLATYRGDDDRGRFPLDPISMGWLTYGDTWYGPMRFITIGPYSLTKNTATATYDSINATYALGVGSISWEAADSIGRGWLAGTVSDEEKDAAILTGVDSLFQSMDRAYWAWSRDMDVPDPLPPPDIEVTSGADQIVVSWSYPDADYYKDPDTGVDDWAAWRVYKKRGAAMVNDPDDLSSGDRWVMIHETQNKTETTFTDEDVIRGVNYYYAVSAVDDGTQNTDGLFPGQALESSRYANRTGVPAIPFKAGLDVSDEVLVVPNPVTSEAGDLAFPGEPDRVLFANLPSECELHLFTETGDLIYNISHSGTDQEYWDQRTDGNQYVASGIYILSVTQAKSAAGISLPDQYVKFIIIR
ncbi:hypothetical protein ACFL6Q_04110 [Candidatus Neomarinimicrobiota bacterium]